jgi:hypothetical protein
LSAIALNKWLLTDTILSLNTLEMVFGDNNIDNICEEKSKPDSDAMIVLIILHQSLEPFKFLFRSIIHQNVVLKSTDKNQKEKIIKKWKLNAKSIA